MKFINFSFPSKSIGKEFDCSSPKVPLNFLNSDSIIYSFGAGEDIRYEFLLNGCFGSKIHIFDPTPRAIKHFEVCKNVIRKNLPQFEDSRFGRGDPNYFESIVACNPSLDNINYHPLGLYDCDSTFKFYFPKNPDHVSLSIDNMQKTDDYVELPTKPLDMLMADLGDGHINLLKLNIEGAEVKSLLYMMKQTTIRPDCIVVMFELFRDKPTQDNKAAEDEVKRLLLLEYELAYCQGDSHTFVKK